MTSNPNFANPHPPLAGITAALSTLDEAYKTHQIAKVGRPDKSECCGCQCPVNYIILPLDLIVLELKTMRGKKILVIIIALGLVLAGIVALRLRREKPIAPSVSETSRSIGGPAFEVQVEMPAFNSGRAPWEIPGVLMGYDHGPRFDQASPGAQVGKIAPDHIELSAEGGWNLLIETDAKGRLAQGTHVEFPVKLGGRPLKFDCRPADPSVGYLHTNARTGSDELEGNFQLEVAICKNAVSGKKAAWPYQPLKVRGNFAGLKRKG